MLTRLNTYILTISIIIIACNKKDSSISNTTEIRVDSSKSVISHFNNENQQIEINDDSINLAFKLLLKCSLISNSFPFEDILCINTYELQKGTFLSLVKINGNKYFNEYDGGAIYNILILHNINGISFNKWFSSIYEDDFSFSGVRNEFASFNSYSSSVGYSIIVIVKMNSNELYLSDQLEEWEQPIFDGVDFEGLFLKVKDLESNVMLKKITRVSWNTCQ